jgi:hypothetical protein
LPTLFHLIPHRFLPHASVLDLFRKLHPSTQTTPGNLVLQEALN